MTGAAYIVAARRTPIGKLNGGLAGSSAAMLGAAVIAEIVRDLGIAGDDVSEVITGQVLTAGAGQNPARQASIGAGLPVSVPSMTINKVCGAGQKSIHLAAQSIRCGDSDVVLAGGQDSLSSAPHLMRARRGIKAGESTVEDAVLVDGLIDAFHGVHMGVTVENLVRRFQITRREQDEFALNSQQKTAKAIAAGRFDAEIVPVAAGGARIETDEHPNAAASMEKLASLKPVFDADGGVTAGNASGLNDGAAYVAVMSEEAIRRFNAEPMARIVSYAAAAIEPMDMGLAPVDASRRALDRAGWRAADLDLMEINEAFAGQAIAVNRAMGWDAANINVNGGAIALGHPLAASGCRIVVTLLHEMRRRRARKGLASLCIGGGQAVALCVESF